MKDKKSSICITNNGHDDLKKGVLFCMQGEWDADLLPHYLDFVQLLDVLLVALTAHPVCTLKYASTAIAGTRFVYSR